jgi:hypothetical protein
MSDRAQLILVHHSHLLFQPEQNTAVGQISKTIIPVRRFGSRLTSLCRHRSFLFPTRCFALLLYFARKRQNSQFGLMSRQHDKLFSKSFFR